jgi:hypothetical protein
MLSCITMSSFSFSSTSTCHLQPAASSPARTASQGYTATPTTNVSSGDWPFTVLYWAGYINFWEGYSLLFPDALHVPQPTETLRYDCIPMIGLHMPAFSLAPNTDTQKPHTHALTSHMVVIFHTQAGQARYKHYMSSRGLRCAYEPSPIHTGSVRKSFWP